MGSTLPLVEIRLRMGPRSTVVVRTRKGSGASEDRDERQRSGDHADTDPGAASCAAGRPFELFGCCQLVIFQDAAGTTASINLPLWRLRKNARLPKPLHG